MAELVKNTPPPVIPNAGVYGAQTAAANEAYNNAVAAATSQRNALYHSYGLNQQGSVDPLNPGGEYQQMLGQQGQQFNADRMDAQQRGLGHGGLANQAESADRANDIGQDFQFQNQVAGVGSDYQNALQEALSGKNSAITGAYNDALQQALQNQIDAMNSGSYDAPNTGTFHPNGTAGDGSDHPPHPNRGQGQSRHAQHQAQKHHNQHHQGHGRRRGGGGRPMRTA